jgi:predicted O-linked N-acetylglucosamine transferase (SPINDLY family)
MAPAGAPSTTGATSPQNQFDQALSLHQAGQLEQAAVLYQAILERDPAHFDALHLLGVIAAQAGDPARALGLIERALAVDARQAAAHYHRALALRDLARHADALAGFAAVLALDPAHIEAWTSHAQTQLDLQRPADALQSYDRALALAPGDVQARFARGVILQNLQRHAEALADYEAVLAREPDFAGALHNRGMALHALGRTAQALASYELLLALAPEHAPAHYGRGLALEGLGRHAQALASQERALALQPDFDDARLARARLLRALGQPGQALEEYARLLAAAPEHAEALFEQGATLQALQRHAQAVASYDRALVARPGFAEACNNRALALLALNQPEQALAACEQAIAIKPDFAEAWSNRGLALHAFPGGAQQALDSYDRALALRPDYAEAHANRGHLLQEMRRWPAALGAYESALAIEPRNPDYLYGRGAILHLLDRPEEALASYEQALAVQPRHLQALSNYAGALQRLRRHAEAAAAYGRLLDIDSAFPYALGNRLHMQLHVCDWDNYAQSRARVEAAVAAGGHADMPFSFLAVSDSAALQLQCARLHAASGPAAAPLWQGERYGHQRMRVAYVSADLGFHPVSYLMAELLELHDRRRFELIAVSLRPPGNSAFDARMRAAFDRYLDASALSDLEIARLMREQEVDLAVDLMGYTGFTRSGIFAHRPAPLHAAYLGYAGTLGSPQMDYLIADPVVMPPGAAVHYAEQVASLPPTFMPRDRSLAPAPAPARSAVGLPERGFVFCCFNQAYKLNPPVFGAWMRLLRATPGSVLWLSDCGPEARANLLREAARRGVPGQRIVFAARTPGMADHLGRIALADLFLDTLPYNAHTTASDALWAGVPVLTCTGEAFASRVAASLLTAASLPELITANLNQYEALALDLAANPARLAPLRARLAASRANGQLFDTASLCRDLEQAYAHMQQRVQQGLAAAAFTVAP